MSAFVPLGFGEWKISLFLRLIQALTWLRDSYVRVGTILVRLTLGIDVPPSPLGIPTTVSVTCHCNEVPPHAVDKNTNHCIYSLTMWRFGQGLVGTAHVCPTGVSGASLVRGGRCISRVAPVPWLARRCWRLAVSAGLLAGALGPLNVTCPEELLTAP